MNKLQAAAALITIGTWLGGCGSEQPRSSENPSPSSNAASDPTSLLSKGRVAYSQYCIGCHGVDGDGRGDAAPFLHPSPRDFRRAAFKFSSTRTGLLPTDADLRRTIVDGLPGSAMTGFPLLPESTVDALIAYIKSFSPRWQGTAASEIPFVANPYGASDRIADAIARGEVVYHGFATCWSCHPAYVSAERINAHLVAMENPPRDSFRSNLSESVCEPDASSTEIVPPDFQRDPVRAGRNVRDLYRSIAAGITGTAMPTWIDSMDIPANDGSPLVESADLWATAYYVRSLIQQRPAKLTPDGLTVRDRRQPIMLTDAARDAEVGSKKTAVPAPTEAEVFEEDE